MEWDKMRGLLVQFWKRAAQNAAVGAENLDDDSLERVVHSYGKGLRDPVRIRRGDLGRDHGKFVSVDSAANKLQFRILTEPRFVLRSPYLK